MLRTTVSAFLFSALCPTQAFVPPQTLSKASFSSDETSSATSTGITSSVLRQSLSSKEDCGCETVYSGKPSEFARENLDYRNVIAKVPLFRIDGSQTTIDDIIGDANDSANKERTSLVVFMRSLG